MNIIQKTSPNYTKGRENKTVNKIIVHWIVGKLGAADAVFANVNSQVSAHYAIGGEEIHQYVKEEDTAWHAGNWLVNTESIGIEHEGSPDLPISDSTYETSAILIKEICNRYKIPVDRRHILGHKEIKATQCPGTLDIDRLITLATKDDINQDIIQKAGYYTEVRNIIGVNEDKFSDVSKRLQNLLISESDYINRLEQVKRLEGQIDLLKEQINALGNTSGTDGKLIQELNANITKLHATINQLGKDKGGLNDQITKLKTELEGCRALTPKCDCVGSLIKIISNLFKGGAK